MDERKYFKSSSDQDKTHDQKEPDAAEPERSPETFSLQVSSKVTS